MKAAIGRVYRFAATHSLPDHFPAEYREQHGHAYMVRVEKFGEVAGDVVIDTERMDAQWAVVSGRLPGGNLNDLGFVTTVEQLAAHFLETLGPELADRVEVWEDDDRFGVAERSER